MLSEETERGPDSPYAWLRLLVSLLVTTIGGVGLWSVVVVLPVVEAEFGVARAEAALPYTLLMVGFAIGGVMMGRLADRFGILPPVVGGTLSIAAGYILAGQAETLWQFALAHGVLIGLFGSSATFGPMIADVSRWFVRHRGMAVSICACGSYLAGTVWPPVVQGFIENVGWRQTHMGIGLFCLVTILPLSVLLRRRPPVAQAGPQGQPAAAPKSLKGLSPNFLQGLLVIAGITCCVAMAMPQVHIVALCADLGFGSARGAQMLSLMLATGIVSRLAFGWLVDRLGSLPTLLISSGLQALSLLLFLPFDGMVSLFVVSALFGLAQGGIVPTYAMVVRDFFPPGQAGARIGLVLSATLVGMAIGGWMSGAIYDLTLSYEAAFLNGFAWNLLNVAIAFWLLLRLGRRSALLTT
ncbi:MFS transporter [Oceanibaculum pacificum]|uniref:MFS transporter n=1 Tax=Oceanibaculum pacificum TaxID=580166 RepID=A0A154W2N3_9PROT|nr:MFS transporter [Oceanibaculum pacificum]KZD07780.1 MFS transporter [Oceanibaculum pacificum]